MAAYDRQRGVGEGVIEWALATGRIAKDQEAHWRARPAAAEQILPVMAAGCGAWVGQPFAAAVDVPRPTRVPGADPAWYAANALMSAMCTSWASAFGCPTPSPSAGRPVRSAHSPFQMVG